MRPAVHMLGAMAAVVILTVAAIGGLDAAAQQQQQQKNQGAPNQGPPNALQGFSQNRDQPVKIQAATLEVREKEKQATFSGDVHVTNGDTELRCKSLIVFRPCSVRENLVLDESLKVLYKNNTVQQPVQQHRRTPAKNNNT